MGLGYHRDDLCALADGKLQDALLLLAHGRCTNCYYLAGYAVEIGLKACLAKQVTAETIPDKEFMKNFLTHEPRRLVGLAGLTSSLNARVKDPAFAANWAIVCEWESDARYVTTDQYTAQVMIDAVAHPQNGVFAWIKANW